jgi:hypothetical protein
MTDLSVYDYDRLSSAEMDYVGNPTHYHTHFDEINNNILRYITYEGNILANFIMQYKHIKDESILGMEISLLCVVMNLKSSLILLLYLMQQFFLFFVFLFLIFLL